MSTLDSEVAIIGAGPSGLATAMYLIRMDAPWAERVIVLEKSTHPRHKLCAGGITRFGLDQLSALGLTLDVPFIPVDRVRLKYRDRSVSVHGRPIIVVTWRQELDAWLAGTARSRGVVIHENTSVTGLERRGDRILLHTPGSDYRARVVVGADGSTGVTRRWLGGRDGHPTLHACWRWLPKPPPTTRNIVVDWPEWISAGCKPDCRDTIEISPARSRGRRG